MKIEVYLPPPKAKRTTSTGRCTFCLKDQIVNLVHNAMYAFLLFVKNANVKEFYARIVILVFNKVILEWLRYYLHKNIQVSQSNTFEVYLKFEEMFSERITEMNF